jgi:hypothetical protein
MDRTTSLPAALSPVATGSGAQRDAVDQRPEVPVDERERVRVPAAEGTRDILIRRLAH